MPESPWLAHDAGYRFLKHLFAQRSRGLPSQLVNDRVASAFRTMCQELQPTLSLEIGAHEGSFSRWLKAEVPTARCVAFEANPFVHEKYAAELEDAGVEYWGLAVSETNGTIDLGIPVEFYNPQTDRHFRKGRTNRMASLGQHRWAEKLETVSVPSITLDDFVGVGQDDVVVLWIDVEGANSSVLSSGEKVLSQASLVYIEVEVEPVWEGQWLDVDVARFMADQGLVPVLRDVRRRHQYNVVFAAAELAESPSTARLANSIYRRSALREFH